MGKHPAVCELLVLALLVPAPVWSQPAPLSELLFRLSLTPLRLAPDADDHTSHFSPDVDIAFFAPFVITQQLISQLTTGPIGSPAGGFSYSFDSRTGLFTRESGSFGPVFAERALTNGRGKLTMGVSFQRSNYTSYGGRDLRYGDFKFYLRHRPVVGDRSEGDLIETSASLHLSKSTTTTFGNLGLTDRWDVTVAVPYVHVEMDAVLTATILRLATGEGSDTHRFLSNGTNRDFVASSGSASGLGDVLVRSKFRLVERAGGGVAAALDVQLPTGDERNLLGASAVRTTVTAIASASRGRVSPHLNVSYTKAGDTDAVLFGEALPDELGYRVGAEFALHPTVTLAGTLVGRRQFNAARLNLVDVPWHFTNPDGVASTIVLGEYAFERGTLDVASVAVGGKVNLWRTLVLSGNLLVSLTSAGATARITPVMSVDYTF